MKKILLVVLAAMLLCATGAFADTYQLNCTTTSTCSATSWGTISVTQDGSIANRVDVSVVLNNAFFVDTGGHYTFTFNLNGTPTTVALDGTYSQNNFSYLGAGSYSQSGFGTFGFAFNCNAPGGSATDGCGPGASNTTTGPLTFYVEGAGFTPSNFIANSDGVYFSADLYYQTAAGGFVTGPIGSMGGTPSVPEPTSMALLGTGMVGLAGAIRRKLGKK